METDQQGLLADEEEEEEEASCKKQKIFVDKVNSTIPFQPTDHKAHSSNSTNSISVAAEISKEIDGKMPFIREIPFHEKRPLFGNEWQNMGIYHSVSKDPFGQKEEFLGTEESQDFSSNMHKFQRKEPLVCIESSFKETSCLMSNVHAGTESSDECNTNTSNHKTTISLIGVRKQKNGRYGAVITDKIRHKQVWLGTFDTIEEASQAYFSKKLELENEKLNQQGKKVNKANENCDQTQPPESPVIVASLSVANIASVGIRNERLELKTATHIVGVHKSNKSEKEPESSKETSCLMANVRGTESSNECNTSTSCNPKVKIGLLGIRRQKNGKYGAVIRDTIRHKQVWLGTFDTIEEASQAYFSKKLELENEKLNLQGNKEYRPNMNPDPVQQPKSPIVPSLSVADDQTVETASVDSRNKRTDSHEAIMDIIGVRKKKTSGKEPESSTDPACLMANVDGTESYYECNTSTTCNPKGKRSLLGIRRQKNGKYGAVIRDPIRHERVRLGTFNTAEQASKAYLAKQCEFAQPVTANQACNQSPISNSTKKSGAPKRNKADYGKMPFIREISSCDKRPLLGVESQNMGILKKDHLKKKQVCSDTLESGKEASKGIINSNMHGYEKVIKVNQGKESIICVESSKETSCLMSKSSDDGRNNVTLNPKFNSGLRGIREQKNGKFGAEIRDPIRHKQVWLGTFDTVEGAEQAYLSKKSEFHMLSQRKKENKPKHCDQILHAASVGGNKKMDSPKTTCTVGVNKNKWGRYTSEIINPISMQNIWLGTFGTYEEASQAYQSKKLEFQKLVKPKKKCNKKIHEKQIGKEKLVNVNQGHVNCEAFQLKSTAEETFHANQYMKFDAERSKEAELQSNMPNEDADLWTGQWVQLPGGKEVNFSLKLGLPIIDNYGSLLGEFSSLDDLRIYQTEDDNE